MAAVISAGPRAALSHRSAGQLWGLVPRSGGLVDVTRPTRFRSRHGIRGHCSPLPADEVTAIDGIAVTDLARTLYDLASSLPRRQLANAFNEAEVQGLSGRLSVHDLLERYPERHGSAALRALLRGESRGRGVTRRQLEERFAAILDGASDLPRPRLNADLAVQGRFFQVDCLWTVQRLVVELDGRAVHRTRRAFERDREKDRLLAVDGWRVVRITWRQLQHDAAQVLADLRRLLGAG